MTFEKRPWGEKRTELAPCFPQMLNFTNNITLSVTNTLLVAYKYHLFFYKCLSLEIKLHFIGQELSSYSTLPIISYFYSSPRLVEDWMEELIVGLLLVENAWCQKQSWSFMHLLCSGMVGFGLRQKLGTAGAEHNSPLLLPAWKGYCFFQLDLSCFQQ